MNERETEPLAHRYGGLHSGSWVNHLPNAWVPYVQLARLSPPVALFLIYLPHFYGVMHIAVMQHKPYIEVLRTCGILLGGSFFYSNAAHAWNDLIDVPVDKRVARTKNRPLVRGDVSPSAAFIFALLQSLGAAIFLPFLPQATAISTVPSIVGAIYYPWAKLHIYFPQLVLGACLAWGVMVGTSAMGIKEPCMDISSLYLVVVLTIWTCIYDTVYAYQDIKDDEQAGVMSIPVLFKGHTKKLLWLFLCTIILFWALYIIETGVGPGFCIFAAGGSISSLGVMIWTVELESQSSCWWWFSTGFWFPGGSIALGFLFEYIWACLKQ